MSSILITGCNRGLGLGLVKQFLNATKPTKYIFATCRNPADAKVNPEISSHLRDKTASHLIYKKWFTLE